MKTEEPAGSKRFKELLRELSPEMCCNVIRVCWRDLDNMEERIRVIMDVRAAADGWGLKSAKDFCDLLMGLGGLVGVEGFRMALVRRALTADSEKAVGSWDSVMAVAEDLGIDCRRPVPPPVAHEKAAPAREDRKVAVWVLVRNIPSFTGTSTASVIRVPGVEVHPDAFLTGPQAEVMRDDLNETEGRPGVWVVKQVWV